MNILILGGNRFVGKSIADTLSSNNTVTVLNRTGTPNSVCTVIKCDRDNVDDLKTYIGNVKYDLIIDMCCYNYRQVQELESVLTHLPDKYICMSTLAVTEPAFGDYTEGKLKVEYYLSMISKLPYVILRPGYILGEGNPHKRIQYYTEQLINNQPIDVAEDGNFPIVVAAKDEIVEDVLSAISSQRTRYIKFDTRGFNTTPNKLITYLTEHTKHTPTIEYNSVGTLFDIQIKSSDKQYNRDELLRTLVIDLYEHYYLINYYKNVLL